MNRLDTYLEKLQQLARGEADPKEISTWAIEQELELNSSNIELSELEEDVLSELQLSGALNEKGAYLYSKADFQDWLNGHNQDEDLNDGKT